MFDQYFATSSGLKHILEHNGPISTLRILLFLMISCAMFLPNVSNAQLIGSVAKCDNEGEEVYVPNISDDPCISCLCQGGEVTCAQEKCPSLDGCHTILHDKPASQCCDKCTGCTFQSKEYDSGAIWRDSQELCKTHSCQGGVVTTSKTRCHAVCDNPVRVPGQCCPVCKGCKMNGVTHREGTTFTSPLDPCATCTCQNGTVQCSRSACPVLNCLDRYVITHPGTCCPVCKGKRSVFDLQKKACLFRNKLVTNGTSMISDTCTNCTCITGTMVCQRRLCPPLSCHPDHVMYDSTSCCPLCVPPKKQCKFKGKQYKHNTEWHMDLCTNCSCTDGVVHCRNQQCSNMLQCPLNSKPQYVPGRCCPVCVEVSGVCAVFGDPHYKTFDGSIFNFQGTCSYILAQDCRHGNFSIRVRNDARLTNDFAWTKVVSVHIGKWRISLQQKLRVKVNRKLIKFPFTESDGLFAINKGGFSVTLKTAFGLKVIWDGDSYLEVIVPPSFKNQMCGLCGNYNGLRQDDMVGKDNALYFDANDFGETWRAGKSKTCGKKQIKQKQKKSPCKKRKHKTRAQEECSLLHGAVFSPCLNVVDVTPYYSSCLQDVCDCPKRKECACESLTAYARACSREGIDMNWRTPGVCGAAKCPRGAIYNTCASACPITCDNWDQPHSCDKPCIPRCQCPAGTVLHKNKCISNTRCKNKRKKNDMERDKRKPS